jgi:hypothetical protein
VEIDPHSSEDAILLRYDVEEEGGKVLRKSKMYVFLVFIGFPLD